MNPETDLTRTGASAARRPTMKHRQGQVRVWTELAVIPTYLPALPDKNPMFLEKRVYQGSGGKVYPLPFTDRIAETPVNRKWKAVWIENEFIRAMVLPELGGRIHVLQDKTNGYDLIYRQPVIKPALVGLAGPWISGGIELNWPQHHRPATFLPVDWRIEDHADGSKTIWCSDHDPLFRMKGMHGVCLHPAHAYLELKVRVHNRTPFVQTFLWWANVATRVHEAYQSFFPPDVNSVADHARRSTSAYPLCQGRYYGVDYRRRARNGIPRDEVPRQFRPAHSTQSQISHLKSQIPRYAPNDLSFYANIPVPTSYMCVGSDKDFFGGYDYAAEAGIVHFANHHISPGKKQWTWGNHEFGYAWDRNLTDPDARGEYGPYIEIMAGVYTDNQPDFSFLQPGETKTWSQFWYPIRKIGPARDANLDAAISANVLRRKLRVGVAVTSDQPSAIVIVSSATRELARFKRHLSPARPMVETVPLPAGRAESDLLIRVIGKSGRELIAYRSESKVKSDVPEPATEPPQPRNVSSADELYLTGLHLEQYRHATRSPASYWNEALRRDPLDSRCNNALGLWHLRRGEFERAEVHFRNAITRLTRRNGNPRDGEAHYNLGVCLRFLDFMSQAPGLKLESAYAAFYKATWNQAWVAPASQALAEIDCLRQDWTSALEHLNQSLRFDTNNLRARNLKVLVLRRSGERRAAAGFLVETLRLDSLDWWARHLAGDRLDCDLQTQLDISHDYARAGFYSDAIELLGAAASANMEILQAGETRWRQEGTTGDLPNQSWGALPLVFYTLGWFERRRGNIAAGAKHFNRAAGLSPDYCFPSRLEEIAILNDAIDANPRDAHAPYYLGNLLYDRRRHEEAIRCWERSVSIDGSFSTVWRNLGIGYFNVRRQPLRARAAYDRAFKANASDARLLYERDQLWKRLGVKPHVRLRELEAHSELARRRDDLIVQLCALYNQTRRHGDAARLLEGRRFQPWEGGEGGPLGQHVRTQLAFGRQAMERRNFQVARKHFENALAPPFNLGEARHLLANQSDIHYWLGCAFAGLQDKKSARRHWLIAATFQGDFQEMSVRSFSEMTYYSALAWKRLGRSSQAKKLLRDLLAFAERLENTPAQIDYFATSLPTMLLFDDDLQGNRKTTALFLQAQAQLGLGRMQKSRALLRKVLRRDPNHALAADLSV